MSERAATRREIEQLRAGKFCPGIPRSVLLHIMAHREATGASLAAACAFVGAALDFTPQDAADIAREAAE